MTELLDGSLRDMLQEEEVFHRLLLCHSFSTTILQASRASYPASVKILLGTLASAPCGHWIYLLGILHETAASGCMQELMLLLDLQHYTHSLSFIGTSR